MTRRPPILPPFLANILAFASLLCVLATLSAKELIISSTIDFLDYAFEYTGDEGYFTEEAYEKAIRAMAENGIRKIYLRVNICGLTHYPSKVSRLYGEEGQFHWNTEKGAMKLIETYKHYDPCQKTIELGHKYGMEVWAWESLFDDAGLQYSRGTVPEKYDHYFMKYDGWALLDPFYFENPDACAMMEPTAAEALDRQNRLAAAQAERHIGKLVLGNPPEFRGIKSSKLNKDTLEIYVSSDNLHFRLYKGDFKITSGTTDSGALEITISGLDIPERYVILRAAPKVCQDSSLSMILAQYSGQYLVYDTDGKPFDFSTWTWGEGEPSHTRLAFGRMGIPAAWDYSRRYLGFTVAPVPACKYYYGVAEFNVPKAMKHKVDRFVELARFPFDGFMFNGRCHSALTNGEDYGFNPEVLAKFKKRFGHAYSGTQADREGVFQLRAEAIAEFFKRCKAAAGGRPLYISGPVPLEMKDHPDYNAFFGPLPWLYKQYIADGSVDGIIMSGKNFHNCQGLGFAQYFTKEITGGRPVKIGIFREMLGRPKNYDFHQDMKAIRASNLDEVELYESMALTNNPKSLEVTKGTSTDGWTIDWHWP